MNIKFLSFFAFFVVFLVLVGIGLIIYGLFDKKEESTIESSCSGYNYLQKLYCEGSLIDRQKVILYNLKK